MYARECMRTRGTSPKPSRNIAARLRVGQDWTANKKEYKFTW